MCTVRFVYGRSGSGKTYKLCQDIIVASIAMPERNYYMVVPEQFTMETQKRLASMHPDGGVMDIDILSFDRLAYRVFEELSVKTNQVLEDIGKTMVISHLLDMHSDELMIFSRSAGRPGFHDEMKSMICELFQYGIHREDVESAMGYIAKDSVLYMKLHDLLLIYDYFTAYIEGHYIVAEQLLDLAGDYVTQSKKLTDAVIFFDGFTGFTPVQYVMLQRMFGVAADMCFAITMPAPKTEFGKEHNLFHMGYKMYCRLTELAGQHPGAEFIEDMNIELTSDYRHREASGLSHLERNIFTYPYEKFRRELSDVQLFSVRSAREELHETARRIRGLVEQGYRYRDIAVVTGDLEGVAYLAEEIFAQYHIPNFIDQNTDMRKNPFVAWILSLWRIVTYQYRRKDVIAYIKSGFSMAVSARQAGQLENYALSRNIDSKSGWHLLCQDMYIEDMRKKLMEELSGFEALLTAKTVRDYLQASYLFSVQMHIERALLDRAAQFEKEANYHQAGIYMQIYPKMMGLFDKIVDVLGEEKMSYSAFYTVLETGVNSLDIGMIPQGLDQVIVGDITRTRLSDIKILFLINANEGIIPKNSSRGMILSDGDREYLSDMMALAPSGRTKGYQEQFYLYLTLTKPSERLIISYHKLTMDNKGVRPSYLISRLTSIFPMLSVEETDTFLPLSKVYTMEDGGSLLLQLLKENGEEREKEEIVFALLRLFENTPEEKMMLSGISYPVSSQTLPRDVAAALYGERPMTSVSRLEKYAGCAYAFFLEYGLRLKEQKLFEIQTADTGSILHETIEKVFTYFKEQENGVRQASVEGLISKTKELLEEVIKQENYAELFDASKRNRYLYHTLERVAVKSVTTLRSQLLAGRMVPEAFELAFGEQMSYTGFLLSPKITMHLRGVVDRVDVLADNEKKKLYVQVIDYKSGEKDIDYTKLYYGTQLQLFVYMNVVREWAKEKYPDMEIVPVGMYYFHMHDMPVDCGNIDITEEELEHLKDKDRRLSGLTIEEAERIALVDNGPGRVLPVGLKKDGSFRASESLVSDSVFANVCDYAYAKVKQLGRCMYEGDIEINPFKLGQQTACMYCKFAGICMFDPEDRDRTYRYLVKKSREECREHEVDSGSGKSN